MPSVAPAVFLLSAAALLPLAPRWLRPVVLFAGPVLAGVALLTLEQGMTTTLTLYGYELQPMRVDRLSMAFGTVFVLAAGLSALYGLRTMGAGEQAAAMAYAGSALAAVFAGDLVSFFVFWELKAIASAGLIWLRRTTRAGAAGMRYLFVHVAGGTLLLAGTLAHVSATGDITFGALAPSPATYVILVGLAVSAAIPPLHAWLPDAYPEASIAGTVFLSAFTTKAGVYALARGFAGYEVLVVAGVVMALYGVVYAVLENDIRRLLGYHIISQVGYMVAAVGIGTAVALNGATAHAFAHILYKGLLLMGAGAVIYATGREKLTELGGFARQMPAVVVLYMVGAVSISGFPLFSGFVSKELVTHAASLDGRILVLWLLKLASVGTFLHAGLKLPYGTWFGPRRTFEVRAIPATMYVAMGLTAALNLAIGVYPAALYGLMPFTVDYQPYTADHLVEITQLLVFTALGFWLLIDKLGGEPTVSLDTDWVYRSDASRRVPVLVGDAVGGMMTAAGQRGRAWSVTAWQSLRAGSLTGARGAPSVQPIWALGMVVLVTFVVVLGLRLVS
jgi:multicomponent Na+:H+ antiporter subunit D